MRIVLDTNVLVSGLLSPFGAPGEIVRMASAGTLQVCYDARILSEYKNVLRRPKFSLDALLTEALLDQVKSCGHSVASKPLDKPLPDPNDEPFLEVAIAGKAVCLITGNLKHYPQASRQGVNVFPPSVFFGFYRSHK